MDIVNCENRAGQIQRRERMQKLTHDNILELVPHHLQQYVVEQHYDRYTSQDHSVWRYIIRKNLSFLGKHAHPAYLDGLQKTGISEERIPDIIEMNQALQQIGWSAVVVNGFIPPAAFMEFQANKILVISAEMRTVGHILYTPAPDIVHEAAGHAPIIADAEYSEYLQRFGEYGAKAMSSKIDFEIYEAIRNLSIIKEYPYATEKQVSDAETNLEEKLAANTIPSEATKLSRLHWWTVEYGLIGTPDNFKQYGAGLLSSVGESQGCLNPKVKKIPLTTDCVNYNYDITTMQPQLFVTESWQNLMQVLEEFSETMCFRTGGLHSLRKAIESENVATAVYSSGLQVSGRISEVRSDKEDKPTYLKTEGNTALAFSDAEIAGHGIDYHKDGLGSPMGKLSDSIKPLENYSDTDLSQAGIIKDHDVKLTYSSGVTVEGKLKNMIRSNGKLLLLSFTDCTVRDDKGSTLFLPGWGIYDMAVGDEIVSVYSGTADKEKFNVLPPKSENVAIEIEYEDKEKHLFTFYKEMRDMRSRGQLDIKRLNKIYDEAREDYPEDWLIRLELYEMAKQDSGDLILAESLRADLEKMKNISEEYDSLITSGLDLLDGNKQDHPQV
jgi:phenylalanine-4-hydroxylase